MKFTTSTPHGCQSVESHERELLALAEVLEARAREMLDSDGRIDIATGNQLALAAIRARGKAADLAAAREARDYEVWLVEHEKQMSAGGHRQR
jgi:hypothetical protein